MREKQFRSSTMETYGFFCSYFCCALRSVSFSTCTSTFSETHDARRKHALTRNYNVCGQENQRCDIWLPSFYNLISSQFSRFTCTEMLSVRSVLDFYDRFSNRYSSGSMWLHRIKFCEKFEKKSKWFTITKSCDLCLNFLPNHVYYLQQIPWSEFDFFLLLLGIFRAKHVHCFHHATLHSNCFKRWVFCENNSAPAKHSTTPKNRTLKM